MDTPLPHLLQHNPRATRSDFSSSAWLFRGTRTRRAPVISHVTEHQSNGRDVALAPAEADLQTLAGNTITHPAPEGRAALCGFRREERREGVDTENCFPGPYFTVSFQGLQARVSTAVHKSNFQLSGVKAIGYGAGMLLPV